VGRSKPQSWVYDVPLEAISQEVSRATGITEDRLYSATRDREGARGRVLVAYLAKTVSGYMVKEIADYFKRSSVTIGEAIIKVEDPLRKVKMFGKMLTFMGENLIRGRKRKYRISVAFPHN
jgi:chromosomal replication initiation ATPase DnaA